MKNIRKSLLVAAGIATAAFAAVPAAAWYTVTYYDDNGQVVGSALYCNNGSYQGGCGQQTRNQEFDYTHSGELPC